MCRTPKSQSSETFTLGYVQTLRAEAKALRKKLSEERRLREAAEHQRDEAIAALSKPTPVTIGGFTSLVKHLGTIND